MNTCHRRCGYPCSHACCCDWTEVKFLCSSCDHEALTKFVCVASATAFHGQLLRPFLFPVAITPELQGNLWGREVYVPQSSALQGEIPGLVLDRAPWYWTWFSRVPMDGEISPQKAQWRCFRWVMVVAKPLVPRRAQDCSNKMQPVTQIK